MKMEKQSYFTISELAKEFNVKKNHIRLCEEKGLISPKITKLNRRIYNKHDRARLNLIFYWMLVGYSQDQIIELIGAPDVDLDKVEQIRKSLEHCEKKLSELEKRCKDLQVHQRTNIITDINMLREYEEELKTISATKPHSEDKERKKAVYEPVETITPETEKKPEQRPIRMIPVYVAGLAAVLIIAGYFYYQSGLKENKMLYFAQKEQPKAETHPVYRDSLPSNDTGDQLSIAVPQPLETPASPLPIQQDSLTEEPKELVKKEAIKDPAEKSILLSKVAPSVVMGKPPSSEQKDLKVHKEKVPVKEGVSVRKEKEAKLTEDNKADSILQAAISAVTAKPATASEAGDILLTPKKRMDKKLFNNKETARAEVESASGSHVEKTKLDMDQDGQQPGRYTVSLYYANEENKDLMEGLAISIKNKGFRVLGIERVDYQNSDIRYFHSWDKTGALLLQEYSTAYITPHTNLKDTKIRIKDLSQEYPNARKGSLELWINL